MSGLSSEAAPRPPLRTNPQAVAERVLAIEADGIAKMATRLDENFALAVAEVIATRGRVIVCGMGKSGIIAHKIAATLMSTGTPSFYMHPGEAYHGDLGMVAPEDLFLAVSNSGETDEVVKLLPFLNERGNVLISFTGNRQSSLAAAARYHIDVGVELEACRLQLAPTASTTAALAMGDALALAVMEERDFTPDDFARFHPGGTLGRRLLQRVEQETQVVPSDLRNDSTFEEVVDALARSTLGLAAVRHSLGWGLITDGDLRRAIRAHGPEVFALKAGEFMTTEPEWVPIGTRSEDALAKMVRLNIGALLVFDGDRLVGAVKR